MRGIAPGSQVGEWLVATGLGSVARYRPAAGESDFIAHGYDQLMGIATNGKDIVFAEYATGRVHAAHNGDIKEIANGLDKPMGVAMDGDTAYVTEAGAGRIVKLRQGNPVETVVDGLGRPEGLCLSNGKLYIVDTEVKALIKVDVKSGARATIAGNLPVGAPKGVRPKFLGPIGDMAGPMINFAGVAAAADGTLYVSADAEGSVLAVRPS
jgi:sugar lactone lactonase YvrE